MVCAKMVRAGGDVGSASAPVSHAADSRQQYGKHRLNIMASSIDKRVSRRAPKESAGMNRVAARWPLTPFDVFHAFGASGWIRYY
jgi:hypothetical protein